MLGERLTSGKPTQECRGGECRDTQAKIGTQNPALHGARPSTFKAQVGHSEEDTRNGTRHLEEQGRQSDPVNVGQTAIIVIAGKSISCVQRFSFLGLMMKILKLSFLVLGMGLSGFVNPMRC